MFETLNDYYLKSNSVTLGVLALLALYFIVINWTFFYRYLSLNRWVDKESDSLESLLMGASGIAANSYLNHFIKSSKRLSGSTWAFLPGRRKRQKGWRSFPPLLLLHRLSACSVRLSRFSIRSKTSEVPAERWR